MPVYEYKCKTCGEKFEVRQSFSDAPLTLHEACGGAVERLISAPAIQFKGSGWYVTDYAKGSGSKPADSGKTETKSDAKPAETKSDSGSAPAAPASSAPAADKK